VQALVPESFTSFVKKYTLIPFPSTTMVPALVEAVLRSTPALAVVDVAEGGDTEAAGAVAEVAGAPVVTAGLVAGAVPVPPAQAVSTAAKARMARPAPGWCFMGCSLAGPGV
jgi:hypothetical protein